MDSGFGARLQCVLLALVAFGLAGPAFGQVTDLSVATYVWDPVVMPNGQTGEFSVRVTNNGPDDAPGAVLTIDVAPHFEALAAPAGCVLSGPVGAQLLTCTLAPFDAGTERTLDYHAVARTVGAQDTLARIAPPAGVIDNVPGNDSLRRTPTVRTGVDFSVGKSASASSVPAASTLTYTLEPANDGPDASAAIRVIDNLPPLSDLTGVAASGSGWNCQVVPGVSATCDYTGVPLLGAYPPITLSGRIAATSGTVTNSARTQSRDPLVLDNDPANDVSPNVVVAVTPTIVPPRPATRPCRSVARRWWWSTSRARGCTTAWWRGVTASANPSPATPRARAAWPIGA